MESCYKGLFLEKMKNICCLCSKKYNKSTRTGIVFRILTYQFIKLNVILLLLILRVCFNAEKDVLLLLFVLNFILVWKLISIQVIYHY